MNPNQELMLVTIAWMFTPVFLLGLTARDLAAAIQRTIARRTERRQS